MPTFETAAAKDLLEPNVSDAAFCMNGCLAFVADCHKATAIRHNLIALMNRSWPFRGSTNGSGSNYVDRNWPDLPNNP